MNVDRFRGPESTQIVVKAIRQTIALEHQIDPLQVMNEVCAIVKLFRERVKDESAEIRKREILRLAEGKGLFIAVKRNWKMQPTCEGHLLEAVSVSGFADGFRARLLELTC